MFVSVTSIVADHLKTLGSLRGLFGNGSADRSAGGSANALCCRGLPAKCIGRVQSLLCWFAAVVVWAGRGCRGHVMAGVCVGYADSWLAAGSVARPHSGLHRCRRSAAKPSMESAGTRGGGRVLPASREERPGPGSAGQSGGQPVSWLGPGGGGADWTKILTDKVATRVT